MHSTQNLRFVDYPELLDKVEKTRISRNPKNYFLACVEANVDPEDQDLIAQYEADQNYGRNGISKLNQKTSLDSVKFPKNWKIRKCDLKKFKTNFLVQATHGLHDVEIPLEMALKLNAAERFAIYVSTGLIKDTEGEDYLDYPHEFEPLLHKLDQLAYHDLHLAPLLTEMPKSFSTNPGDQVDRLLTLEETTRSEFVNSFFKPHNSFEYNLGYLTEEKLRISYGDILFNTMNYQTTSSCRPSRQLK
jgi:hypothetical protein